MDLEPCEDDNDCSPNLYCYKTSNYCVNYTICSRYNRVEGPIPARSAKQCGSCMTGYATELMDGKESPFCQRNINDEEFHIGPMMNIIWPILVIILVGFILLCFIKKCRFFQNWCNFPKINCFKWNNAANTDVATINGTHNNNTLTAVTAPLEEQSPFINLVEDKYRVHGKNRQAIETNEYQTAVPCAPPVWAEDQFYDDNDNARVPNDGNIVLPQILQNNIPDNQSTIYRQSIIELPEANIEQQDNTRNTALLQTCSSDDDTDSSPELNKTSADKKTEININQSLSQHIHLNFKIQ